VAGEIEVALPSGHRVRIRGGFDPELVTRLLRNRPPKAVFRVKR
jgi:hypothetical protein